MNDKREMTFDAVVNRFLMRGQLGHYDPEKFLIELYDVPDDDNVVKDIKKTIEKYTKSYKLAITVTDGGLSNVLILDVGL